ncbi:unnamed protein product [Nezara viridula]|uniref:Gustatory receptor n=1 Tax=Nezara viridula TaxID=85310 RepID=A0A9P0H8T7_NEZVI|nr:unnamed protein product [Nezara viridula]
MDEVRDKFNSMARRIHFFPSVMAAFPLYVSDGSYEISYLLLFLSLLAKAAFSYEALLHLVDPPFITKGMSRFYKFFTIANFEYNYGVSCFSFAKIFFTRKEMNDIFDLMRKSDLMLGSLAEPPDFRTQIIQDGLILIMMALPTTIRFFNLSLWTFANAAEQVYLTWVNFTIYLSIAPFLQLAFILKNRFNLLHRCLLNFAARKQQTKIEQLIIFHTNYCDVSAMLNDCFSQQILLMFTVTFMSIVLGSYRSITAYVVGSGAFVTAKEFNALLYQIMIDDKTNDIATNKKLQLHIAMKREVQFTACGFFPLDYTLVHSKKVKLHFAMKREVQFTACGFFPINYTLVHSMVAAVTTYLVILVQFEQPTTSVNHFIYSNSIPNSTYPTALTTTPM